MRHGKKNNHLGRKAAHRKAMISNMACSLIEHKRINTTVAKAKVLRREIEPLLTKSKQDTTHNRRTAFSMLRSKEAVTELFREISKKIADRPGGYTRIIKLGSRLGDAADMAMIELVDFNQVYTAEKTIKKTTRRGRSKKKISNPDSDTATTESTSKVSEKKTSDTTPKSKQKSEKKQPEKSQAKPAKKNATHEKPEETKLTKEKATQTKAKTSTKKTTEADKSTKTKKDETKTDDKVD